MPPKTAEPKAKAALAKAKAAPAKAKAKAKPTGKAPRALPESTVQPGSGKRSRLDRVRAELLRRTTAFQGQAALDAQRRAQDAMELARLYVARNEDPQSIMQHGHAQSAMSAMMDRLRPVMTPSMVKAAMTPGGSATPGRSSSSTGPP